MIAARCSFGVHLDMNPGLAGFEFYDVRPRGTWQPLGRTLQADWEYEGTIRELSELQVPRAPHDQGHAWHMNFPQYIQREARDFFYLTRRAGPPRARPRAGDQPKKDRARASGA